MALSMLQAIFRRTCKGKLARSDWLSKKIAWVSCLTVEYDSERSIGRKYEVKFWLTMNEIYLISLHLVLIIVFNSVTMKSPGVFFLPPSLLTFGNLPEHKLGFQQLNCRVVHREFNYTEKVMADCLHCSWCLLLS